MLRSVITIWHWYIEVQDVLANAQLRVKRDRCGIAHVRLHENYIGGARRCQLLEFSYQCRRDAFTPVLGRDGKIVDVDLTALLLELLQLVCRKAARDLIVL